MEALTCNSLLLNDLLWYPLGYIAGDAMPDAVGLSQYRTEVKVRQRSSLFHVKHDPPTEPMVSRETFSASCLELQDLHDEGVEIAR